MKFSVACQEKQHRREKKPWPDINNKIDATNVCMVNVAKAGGGVALLSIKLYFSFGHSQAVSVSSFYAKLG